MEKILTLIIKKEYFDAIRSGEKKTETREIRPNTAHKYIEYFNPATGETYKDTAQIPEGADLDARPLSYDAIRFCAGRDKDSETMLVKVESSEIFVLQDEAGEDVIYEYKGEKYVAAQIDYTLGDIIE